MVVGVIILAVTVLEVLHDPCQAAIKPAEPRIQRFQAVIAIVLIMKDVRI
jgi:hypothetical protein